MEKVFHLHSNHPRLEDPLVSLHLLRSCLAVCKVNHLLRSVLPAGFPGFGGQSQAPCLIPPVPYPTATTLVGGLGYSYTLPRFGYAGAEFITAIRIWLGLPTFDSIPPEQQTGTGGCGLGVPHANTQGMPGPPL